MSERRRDIGIGEIADALYASEINWRLSTFWDAGCCWALGDESNGYVDDGHVPSSEPDMFATAAREMAEAAAGRWPASDFARWWRGRGRGGVGD